MVITKNYTQKKLVQMSWHTGTLSRRSDTQNPRNTWTINIFIHFLTTESQGLMRFPHQYPPPRPQLFTSLASTAAFASRSRWTTESWPLRAAKCSGVLSREPQPEAKPRAEPNGTKGRKIRRKFRVLQKSKFWNFWPLKNPPWTSGTMWFWGCFDDIELAHQAMWTRLAVQMDWYHHPLFNLHGPASFSEKQYISACCIQTSIRITTKWNETTPGHCMPLHHQIFKVIKQQHLWGPCPLYLSSPRSSRRCE